MITVQIYFETNCGDCEQILADLKELQVQYPHRVAEINIDQDAALKNTYNDKTPLVKVGPYTLQKPIRKQDLQVALGAALDREKTLRAVGNDQFNQKVERGKVMSGTDRFSLWLSKNYMILFNFVLLVYAGLPFLAPSFMKIGWTLPARAIYTIYSPLCHQLAFRSWFLYGEQAFYPRELAGIPGVITYETLSNQSDINIMDARRFIGNETLGYKVALCERDVAIYGAMFLFGVAFMLTGRRFKPIPWYLWLVFGLIPIGLDGFSQLPSLVKNFFPQWILIRESTPLLRTLTGSLFGVFTAWYLFPMVEQAMQDTRSLLLSKKASIPS